MLVFEISGFRHLQDLWNGGSVAPEGAEVGKTDDAPGVEYDVEGPGLIKVVSRLANNLTIRI